ncbi:MAG: hypothetical protein U0736_16405 [Gemmataceae bacterium]
MYRIVTGLFTVVVATITLAPVRAIADEKQPAEQASEAEARRRRGRYGAAAAWLQNALGAPSIHPGRGGRALGLSVDAVRAATRRLGVDADRRPARKADDPLLVLPYPGGRHPRIGFRDGAVRPQRETKASVFAPWAGGGYAVADVPEAVWFEPDAGKPALLYLAHTHVPTVWDRQKVTLPRLEWTRHADGALALQRPLPNKAVLSATVTPGRDGVRMRFGVRNGTDRPLTGLRVQMCVMLAGLTGFERQTNDNKVFAAPFAACRDDSGKRWVITGWERCGRAWGNPPCPCLHADPVVEDCPPGQERSVRGWLSFYEGADVHAELKRLRSVAFR